MEGEEEIHKKTQLDPRFKTTYLAVIQCNLAGVPRIYARQGKNMSQTFRTPPRQIGFKPNTVRLNPAQATSVSDGKIRQLSLQLQQLQSKLRIQEERLGQLKIPATRQVVETQIQQLRKEITGQQKEINSLRGDVRQQLLKDLSSDAEPFALLEAVYRVKQPLFPRQLNLFETWLAAAKALPDQPDPETLQVATLALDAFTQLLIPAESEKLYHWWQSLRPKSDQPLSQAAEVSFADIGPAEPAPEVSPEFAPISFEQDGALEISFDLQNRKPVVRNQMGITLNQPKKSYQEYLEDGFTAIDLTVASRFSNRDPLYGAVESFLEAVSLDRSRYEAYFGLGYLYSLVKDLNHALYFLDLAWQISGDTAIQEMMDRVRSTCAEPAGRF